MAAPKDAFIDLTEDSPDDDEDKCNKKITKKKKKKRTSLPHDRAQHLTCWVCKQGVMIHVKFVLVSGTYYCSVCDTLIKNDKMTYCSSDDCGFVWCRDCWRQKNHDIRKKDKTDMEDDDKASE